VRPRRALIIGYHGIGAMSRRHDPIDLYVRPELVRVQVRRLLRRGYEFVSMREFAARLREEGGPPRGLAALTFDDGTIDHLTVLPQVLEDLGVPGTVFVCPGLAGQTYPWAAPEAGVRFMTEDEIRELDEHPLIELGAHTNEHYELDEADAETALEQMAASKETLESLIGHEVLSFCYPRCHYSAAARDVAPVIGFTSAVTCGFRGSWDPYELQREVMHGRDGALISALKMRGLYLRLGSRLPGKVVRGTAGMVDELRLGERLPFNS
jgi:peptidoglycan/xylan/chitin deacetylase (PgdA/CDA1 family)